MHDDDDTVSDEMLDIFNDMLDSKGVAASTMSDGTLIGFTLEKLQELVAIAGGNENKKVIILIANDLHYSEIDTEDDPEYKN